MASSAQTLFAIGNRVPHVTQPQPGKGSINLVTANTPAGTHDGNDATTDAYILVPTAAKASGQVLINYDFTPCTVTANIVAVRWTIRARVTTASSSFTAGLQMDNNAFAGPGFVFTTADGYMTLTADMPSYLGQPWTAALVDAAQWFLEMQFLVQDGSNLQIEITEAQLDILIATVITTYDFEVGIGTGFVRESITDVYSLEEQKHAAQNDLRYLPKGRQ